MERFKGYETILELTFLDHQSWEGWHNKGYVKDKILKEGINELKCKVVGYYIGEDKYTISLAMAVSDVSAHTVFQVLKRDIIGKIKIIKKED